MLEELSRKAKMENIVGPGERKRRLREKDRKDRNLTSQKVKRSPAEMSWDVVELCLKSEQPERETANPLILETVRLIGGWEFLEIADNLSAIRPKFLEVYAGLERSGGRQ